MIYHSDNYVQCWRYWSMLSASTTIVLNMAELLLWTLSKCYRTLTSMVKVPVKRYHLFHKATIHASARVGSSSRDISQNEEGYFSIHSNIITTFSVHLGKSSLDEPRLLKKNFHTLPWRTITIDFSNSISIMNYLLLPVVLILSHLNCTLKSGTTWKFS